MKKLFTKRIASYCILTTLTLIVFFHLLVLTSIVPYQIVWGGRLTTHSQMVQFEMISIAINLVMLTVVAIHAGILKIRIKPLLIHIVLWCMCGLFILNTIGNLLSTNTFEKMVFTPVTLLLSICCYRLAMNKQ